MTRLVTDADGGNAVRPARTAEELAAVHALFLEYAEWLGIDLEFQGFAAELAQLPGCYAPPQGELFLAFDHAGKACGCIAVRPIRELPGACEFKRLYLRPQARGSGLGQQLVKAALEAASTYGYREVKLDTLASMTAAQALYRSLGFYPIPAYGDHHSIPGTLYFGRRL